MAQLEALFSQSRFSLRKTSLVVPKCISPLHKTVALWMMEFLPASYTHGYKHMYMHIHMHAYTHTHKLYWQKISFIQTYLQILYLIYITNLHH